MFTSSLNCQAYLPDSIIVHTIVLPVDTDISIEPVLSGPLFGDIDWFNGPLLSKLVRQRIQVAYSF